MSSVLITIVNYRCWELTLECLQSVAETLNGTDIRTVVVDSGSEDDSVDRLSAAIDRRGWRWCRVVAADRNAGFGAANNVTLAEALCSETPPTYCVLLNPDTIVHQDWLSELVDSLKQNESIGIVGPQLIGMDGHVQTSAFRFPSVLGELLRGSHLGLLERLFERRVVAPAPRDVSHRTDWLSGACLAIKTEVLQQIGLFDERFFLYFEEADLCRRAAQQGWECWYVPTSKVVHLVSQTTGVDQLQRRCPQYWFDSRAHYFRKHHGRIGLWLANAAWAGAGALFRLRNLIQRRPRKEPAWYWCDFVRHWLATH